MYVYMHVEVTALVCYYEHTYVCMCYDHLCVHLHMRVHTNIHSHACTHTCTFMYAYTYAYT